MGKGKRNREKRRGVETSAPSPLPPDAPSFRLKLARALHHLQEIDDQVEGWRDACLNTLREEPDPEEPGYFCAWIDASDIDEQVLSLRIGDCLHCLRSALDHLAFELATAFTVPMTDDIEKDSAFPILSDVDRLGNFSVGSHKWRSAQSTAVRGIDPSAQAEIERLQPYQRGKAYDTDPLWILGALNNIDKHRALHVAARVMSGATMPVAGPNLPRSMWPRNVAAIGLPGGGPARIEVRGDIAAEGRTLVARWPMIPIDPSKKMHMGFRPVLDIVFEPATPLVGEEGTVQTLEALYNHIVAYVLPPLVRFLK